MGCDGAVEYEIKPNQLMALVRAHERWGSFVPREAEAGGQGGDERGSTCA